MEETVYAPGAKTAAVRHAPKPEAHESRHVPIIIDTERGMVGSMQQLRIQAVEKNRAFARRVALLRQRRERVQKQLEEETAARDEQLDHLRREIDGSLKATEESLLAAIQGRHDRLHASLVPHGEEAEAERGREKSFYADEVPARNEEMVGELVRRMLRERQAFDIDKVKVRSREREIRDRFAKWKRDTTIRRRAELEDRAETFHTLAELMREDFQREDIDEAAAQVSIAERLAVIQTDIATASEARAEADDAATDEVQKVMHRIQKEILTNFGAD